MTKEIVKKPKIVCRVVKKGIKNEFFTIMEFFGRLSIGMMVFFSYAEFVFMQYEYSVFLNVILFIGLLFWIFVPTWEYSKQLGESKGEKLI